MVVKYTDDGWHITTQRAHGILAAQLAMHWSLQLLPERNLETLLAIAEHDDAEVELDGENLLTDEGGPLNYSMKKFDVSHCHKLSRMSISKSGYITLLTSMHMDFLYSREIPYNKQAATFIKEQRKQQSILRKMLALPKSTAQKMYALLQWCDALSLLICEETFPPEKRFTDISKGPDGKLYRLQQLDDFKLVIEPWPFDVAFFKVYHEYRELKELKFKSSSEFRKIFLNTLPMEHTMLLLPAAKLKK